MPKKIPRTEKAHTTRDSLARPQALGPEGGAESVAPRPPRRCRMSNYRDERDRKQHKRTQTSSTSPSGGEA